MIYPDSFEQKTGFDKVRIAVQNKCVTDAAKNKAANVTFSGDSDEVIMALSTTAEMKTICMLDDSFPDSGYVDLDHCMPKINTEGRFLEPAELLSLRTAIETVGRIFSFFDKKGNDYPCLKTLIANTASIWDEKKILSDITRKIDSIIDRHAKVLDNASPELFKIRKEIRSKKIVVGKRMQSIFKAARDNGIIDVDSGITVRDGHTAIPVPAMNKRKMKGLVVGESSTGKTVFIEPMEVVELNNDIRELEFAEQREIVKILIETADYMRPYAEDIDGAGNILTEIDFIRGKAYYAIETGAGKPLVNTGELRIYLHKAKHPVLMKALAKEKKEVVPLDIELTADKRILLVSGPNAGGKSVCIKTAGLLQYMMQCGFLIPASEISEMSIFQNIFIDIGDEQSLENDLSTYSSHLVNMKFFMKNADSKTLILIDEFGTGTEPTVGGAIAEAVLSDILKKKSFGLITTHYTNLKFFASSNDGIVNGAMLFDTQNIQPLFRLQTGVPGSSFAFEIARKIGLPETVLKEAEAKLGDKQVKMEKSLREIARDKKYWEAKRDRIRKTGQKIDELSETYENELIEIRDIRKKLISEAKEEAQKILATVNREVEKTIRTIKESQADKEKTRIARDKLDKLKQNIAENNFVDSRIEREMRKVKNRISRKAQRQKNNEKTPVQQTPVVTRQEKSLPEIGDRVKIKGQQVAGEIVSSGKGNIAVAFGNIIMNVTPDSVEKVSQFDDRETASRPRSSLASDMLNKKLNFKSLLDVRGERTVDAIEKVTAFVDEAIMLGMSEVKILHGKGNGILREEIRRYLKTFGDILKLSDEQEESGGAGITVVKIN